MKKRIFKLLLCTIVCICVFSTVALATSERFTSAEETMAQDLKALGLFRGVSETNFDLNREPSRIEALIMLVRVLGKEAEALNGMWAHPFTDVPDWADKYVGYAYQNGLTNGISENEFGSGNASSVMYLTFVLRALGYSDKNNLDFSWDNPFSLAQMCGILPDGVNTEIFWRADVVSISYAALPAYLKGSNQTLASKLIASGVFTDTQYKNCYDASQIGQIGSNNNNITTKLSATEINRQALKYVGEITTYDKRDDLIGLGTGFVYTDDGNIITNYHVIDGASSAIFSIDGIDYEIQEILAYDENVDLAVLKIDGKNFDYAEISYDEISVGSTVYAIGSSRGLTNTFSQGIVTYYDRIIDGVRYIQHDSSITNGNSGGPLIDEFGKVIGVNSWLVTDSQNLNFAVSIKEIENLDFSMPLSFSEFGESALVSQYSLLVDWICENATDETDERLIFYNESPSGTLFSISYDFENDDITISQLEESVNSTLWAAFTIKENTSQFDCAAMNTWNSTNEIISEAYGKFNANTYTYGTRLYYSNYYGVDGLEENMKEVYHTSIVLNIEWLRLLLDSIDIGVTMEGLGFISYT